MSDYVKAALNTLSLLYRGEETAEIEEIKKELEDRKQRLIDMQVQLDEIESLKYDIKEIMDSDRSAVDNLTTLLRQIEIEEMKDHEKRS